MDDFTRSRIRHIFLSPRPNFALVTAAELLLMTPKVSCLSPGPALEELMAKAWRTHAAGRAGLGMTLKDLRHEIGIGAIVALPTRLGERISKEE